MTIQRLKESVAKAELKVQKCKATLERHKKQLKSKIEKGADDYDIKWKEDDIKTSTKKLADAERILKNWNNKLEMELEKEKFIEGNAPEVLKVFLENWKTVALDWHIKRYDNYQKFKKNIAKEERKARIECIKKTPEYSRYLETVEDPKADLLNVFPRGPMDKHLKEKGFHYRDISKAKANYAGTNVLHMDSLYKEEERYEWINNVLEKEKKAKMIDLINRINNEIGEILDASNLEISKKGNLDGIIVGEKGSVRIETIGAGGYNIQCFHYRTLINKVK